MKVVFVDAMYEGVVHIPKDILAKLPEKIMLFMTAQLLDQKPDLVKQLQDSGKKVFLTKPRHTIHDGQILGCNTVFLEGDFDAFFYIGDGMFHPQALMMKNDKDIHIFNHAMQEYKLLTKEDSLIYRKRIAIAQASFIGARNIAVLVTTKPGQNKFVWFKKVEKDYPDKNFYYLVNNNIEFDRLKDFPMFDLFINTACERIAYDDYDKFDKPVINFEDLPK